jgi:hypothetical protein
VPDGAAHTSAQLIPHYSKTLRHSQPAIEENPDSLTHHRAQKPGVGLYTSHDILECQSHRGISTHVFWINPPVKLCSHSPAACPLLECSILLPTSGVLHMLSLLPGRPFLPLYPGSYFFFLFIPLLLLHLVHTPSSFLAGWHLFLLVIWFTSSHSLAVSLTFLPGFWCDLPFSSPMGLW